MKRFSIVLLSLLLLSSCSGKPSEEVTQLHEWVADETPSSPALIDEAREAGTINYETSLLYKAYAAFGDEKLPEEYRSGSFVYEYNDVFREIQRNWDQLSQGAKDELAPFLKRPDDPESYFNLRYGSNVSSGGSSLVPAAHAQRVEVYTESIVSADGRIRIWYPNVDMNVNDAGVKPPRTKLVKAVEAEAMAKKIKGYLDKDGMVEDFDGLMSKTFLKDGTKGGDDKLDIYIAPTGSSLALTYCEGTPPCPSYMLIASNIGPGKEDILKTTLAHELFHTYQYAYKYKEPDDDWWSESTATWAEDFIYPAANTEQGYMISYMYRPFRYIAEIEKKGNFQYGAYLFPYFLSLNYGDDYMSKTWEACQTQSCVRAVGGVIDGGFKKQWKDFTLWNYNKDPADFYTDINGFKPLSSLDNAEGGQDMVDGVGEYTLSVWLTDPLSAYLTKVINMADTDTVKKLTFKDLNQFTDFSEKQAIKAVIYYENGKKEIEDWTDLEERSFCLENRDQNFSEIVLIFSNAEIEEPRLPADIKIVGKDNCYEISQEDDRTAVLHFPYQDGLAYKTADINTTIETNSWGEPEEKAAEGQEYAYLTKWKVKNEFEQIKEAFTLDCDGSSINYGPGWTTRSAGYVIFDLGPEGLAEDNTFSVDFEYGLPHPKGNYEEVPEFDVTCIGVGVGAQNIDLSNLYFYFEDIWRGRIFDMTEDGAKIEIFNSCVYHHCDLQTGPRFQTISEPVILEIKRAGQ